MQAGNQFKRTGRRLTVWTGANLAAGGLALWLFGGCVPAGNRESTHAISMYQPDIQSVNRELYRPAAMESQPSATAAPAADATGPAPDVSHREHLSRQRWRDTVEPQPPASRPVLPVNPWTDALDDPKSTFGLDVDTASFAIARDYLRRGLLPPPEAMRTEEFVNAFDYADPTQPEATFSLRAEMAPTPFAPKSYLLRIGLKARPVAEAARKPARLTFVVDVSQSMQPENRLPLLRQALHDLVDRLKPDDQVAIVVFSDQAEVFLNPTPAGDAAAIHQVIDNLAISGATATAEGLQLGYNLAARDLDADLMRRVVLCTDGEANLGQVAPEAILAEVADRRKQGIYLSCIGFGLRHYNDATLETLANQGDGTYDHIDRIDEADRVFGSRLTHLLEVVAQDARIQVEFNADRVAEYRLLGYEDRALADRDFHNDRVDAGEVGAGHAVTALYEVTLREMPLTPGAARQHGRAAIDAAVDALVKEGPPPLVPAAATPAAEAPAATATAAATGLDTLAVIRLRYKNPAQVRANAAADTTRIWRHRRDRLTPSLETSCTLTTAAVVPQLSQASADLRLAMAAARFSELLRNSPAATRADIDGVLALLRSVEQDRPTDDTVQDLYDMALSYKQIGSTPRLTRR